MTLYTAYQNGAIRDQEGTLRAFLDRELQVLFIDGFAEEFHGVESDEAAFDIISENLSK